LLLLTLLPMLATIMLVLALDFRARSNAANRKLEQRTRTVIAALDHDIARLTFGASDRALVLDINDRLSAFPFLERLAVFSSDEKTILSYQKDAWSKHPPLSPPPEIGAHISSGHLYISADLGGFATVLAQVNRHSIKDARAAALKSGLALAVLLALVGMVVVTRLQRSVARRLLALEKTANDVVSTRDFSLRAADDEQDELDHIAAALNTLLSTVESTLATLKEREERLHREMSDRLEAESEVRRVEQQLHDAQKMDSMGRLAAGIAHDFNNLLTVIQGQAQLLEAKSPGEGVSVIVDASRRAAELTGQLLSFSKTAAVALQHVNIPTLFEELERLLQQTFPNHITLQFKLEADLWGVYADAGRLQQVLLNLAINAKDAMSEPGTLSISADNQVVEVDGEDRGFVEIVFRDTGHGMSDETIALAMEPFFSTKGSGGTGLGLAVANNIIQGFGGFLHIESTVGQGSSVVVRLPRSISEKQVDPVLKAWHTSPGGSGTILLVDDQDAVRRTTEQILEVVGYRVLAASGAEDALTLWKDHQAEIDLVLTDMIMPKVSGLELVQQLWHDRPTLAVILVSGHAIAADIQEMRKKPHFTFLTKPYDAALLLGAVGTLLSEVLPETEG
jgi:signal transduction histidine kinase/ActR/RegA family two-component response regulator